jgi:hypothetical protein
MMVRMMVSYNGQLVLRAGETYWGEKEPKLVPTFAGFLVRWLSFCV